MEGDWSTWADGTVVDYSNWASGYPRVQDSYDHGYLYTSNGLWYDYPSTTSSSWRGLIELNSNADSDGDGVPDIIDSHPSDPLNGWDLREAGADGVFGNEDDDVSDLRVSPSYSGGTTVNLRLFDGPTRGIIG